MLIFDLLWWWLAKDDPAPLLDPVAAPSLRGMIDPNN